MQASLYCLNSFIDVKDFFHQPDVLANRLSMSGIEVEEWENLSQKFNNVVIAQVSEKKPHPSADRLSLCQVRISDEKTVSIVCGATNFQTGDLVVVSLPGAVLPGGIKIKERKIRGEKSEGMMLSFAELGFSSEEEGIIVLSQKERSVSGNFPQIGNSFAEHTGLNDVIFKLAITPNRGDCLSHFGLARELSCLLDRKLKPEFSFFHSVTNSHASFEKQMEQNFSISGEGDSVKHKLDLEIKQNELCPRYTGRAIYGVHVVPSPLWLKVRLESLGLKSINNIVDVTNYLMMLWGQPLHAFDLDKLSEKIIVDLAQKDEVFSALDGNEIVLEGQELCIKDSKGTVALAGVIGGLQSAVQEDTKHVFIESACFSALSVRRTSRQLHIDTDSAYRFSHGVPAEMNLYVLHHCLSLMQNVAGGEVSKDEHDLWPGRKSSQKISISVHRTDVEKRLGLSVDFEKFREKIKKLGCEVSTKSTKEDQAEVAPPFFRSDLKIKEDLMEEYARLHGYDHIPEKPVFFTPQADDREYSISTRVSEILSNEGFYQAINHSFLSQQFSNQFLGSKDNTNRFLISEGSTALEPVFLKNPLSAEYNMMRLSLIPSLFKNAEQNIHRGCMHGRLFELGKIFSKVPCSGEHDNQKKGIEYQEPGRLSLVAWGQQENLWDKNQGRACVYDLKSVLTVLLKRLFVSGFQWTVSEEKAPDFIHPFQFLVLQLQGQNMGYIGSLHPLYAEEYKIRVDMALGEINTQPFFSDRFPQKKGFKNISHFPQVDRDIAFLVPKDFPVGLLLEDMEEQAGPLCQSVHIFDIYENEHTLKNNERSVAFRFGLQSDTKTLTENDLKEWHNRLTQIIVSKWPVKLR